MEIWVLVAAVGGLFCLAGLVGVWRRYRRGEVTGWYLAAMIAGTAGFVAFAVVSTLWPSRATGAQGLAILVPAFVAVVVAVREHGKAGHVRE